MATIEKNAPRIFEMVGINRIASSYFSGSLLYRWFTALLSLLLLVPGLAGGGTQLTANTTALHVLAEEHFSLSV